MVRNYTKFFSRSRCILGTAGILGCVLVVAGAGIFLKEAPDSQGALPSPEAFRGLEYREQEELILTLSQNDPSRAWEYLKEGLIVNNEVVNQGHIFAHLVGMAAYQHQGVEGIQLCDPSFSFGCYHGVTQEMLSQEGREGISRIQEACATVFSTALSLERFSCIHGIGHGLLLWEEFDMGASLAGCDILVQEYRQYCYEGVFMEYSFAPQESLDTVNPWGFCERFAPTYQLACVRYVPIISRVQQGSFSSMRELCSTAPASLMGPCYTALGHVAATESFGDAKMVLDSCGILDDPEGRSICISSAAQGILFQRYTGWDSAPQYLCAALEPSWSARCAGGLEQLSRSSIPAL